MSKHTRRNTALQHFVDNLEAMVGDDIAAATDHPRECTCSLCLKWWASMPDEEEGSPMCGPFTREQVEEYRKTH